jgi:tetratricopeptide (TPR) repeat protein
MHALNPREIARRITHFLLLVLLASGCASAPDAGESSASTASEAASESGVVVTVRVWADEGYRDQHSGWKQHARRQLSLVNDMMVRQLDTRLDVVQIRGWNPEAGPQDLDQLLEELEGFDRAEDVDLVVGLTRSLPFGNRSQRRLGYSSLLGKHVLVRGVDPTSDVRELRAELPDADDEDIEREAQMQASHRERTTMLHEIGHTFGAIHTVSEDWLMSPIYRKRQDEFSPENTRILRRSLRLLAESENRDVWKRAVADQVGDMIEEAQDVFISEDAAQVHQHMVTLLEPDSLTRNEARTFNESQDVAQRGDFERALAIMEPLLETRPNHPMVITAACQFRARLEVEDDETLRLCARATEASPDDPVPAMYLAHLHVERGEIRAALEASRKAERRLVRFDEPRESAYLMLASIYQRSGAIARAEDAAQRAGEAGAAADILHWARKLRRTWGLPRGAVSGEVEYLVAEKLREFDQHVSSDQFRAAAYIVERLDREFPKKAFTNVARCRLLTARGEMGAAVPHCRRAVARFESSAMAHYVIGVWESSQRNYSRANEHLSRAISLTPSVRGFWRALGRVYEETGSTDAYQSLADDYRERFGEVLGE